MWDPALLYHNSGVGSGEAARELFSAEVVIQDINDNNPSFPTREMKLEISEATVRERAFRSRSRMIPMWEATLYKPTS